MQNKQGMHIRHYKEIIASKSLLRKTLNHLEPKKNIKGIKDHFRSPIKYNHYI
jgi:capsular polysaccharide biosynthesis protein